MICARGLRAADSNGLSDPYTVVRLGSRSEQTHVLLETLDPDWNEAFVFSAEEIEAAMLSSVPSLLFEVWDSDIGVVADDFHGQVSTQIPCQANVSRFWQDLSECTSEAAVGIAEVGKAQTLCTWWVVCVKVDHINLKTWST